MPLSAYSAESWLKENIVVRSTPLDQSCLNVDSPFVGAWDFSGGYVPSKSIEYI